jgi:hypothetical protein
MRWTGTNDMNTPKRLRVLRLVKKLETGPAMNDPNHMISEKEAGERCRLWLSSWIIPEVKSCLPDIYDRNTLDYIPRKKRK